MPFLKFAEQGRSFRTKVSVRKSGTIGLNSACVEKFAIRDHPYAVLFYDGDEKRVGVKPVKSDEAGAHSIKVGRTGAAISARRFFDYFEIPLGKTQRYDAIWDEQAKMIVFQV